VQLADTVVRMVTKQLPATDEHRAITIKHLPETPDVDWSLLSPQGRILFYIALCPDCSVQEMATALGLTERAVWGIIRELRQQGMLIMRREKRRHRYRVNLDAPLLHPTIEGLTLRPVLGEVARRGLSSRHPNCVSNSESS
jgi:biotin operon repressor